MFCAKNTSHGNFFVNPLTMVIIVGWNAKKNY